MESQPMTKLSVADAAKKVADTEDAFKRLQAENEEHKRLERRFRDLNATLELQLSMAVDEVTQCKNELLLEKQGRQSEREELAFLRQDLLQQQRTLALVREELDSLSYSISHDLRAPLRHVVGFSHVLMEDYQEQLDDPGRNYLDCILRGSQKLEMQIEALLKLSRLSRQEYHPITVDLSELCRHCADALQHSDPQRRVEITIAEKVVVHADPLLLKAALESLWHNAWKYTGKKECASIEFGRKLEGEKSVFFLRDNGAGFDMRYADRLFGPFQRMHREGEFEGVGIGLATAQRIIHRHGGKIWADAAVDEGATFFFTLAD